VGSTPLRIALLVLLAAAGLALAACGKSKKAAEKTSTSVSKQASFTQTETPTGEITTVKSFGDTFTLEKAGGKPAPYQHFVSRPDLKPTVIKIEKPATNVAPGYVFLGPKKDVAQEGPTIVDDQGNVVWFRNLNLGVADFNVQKYQGKPVLTWWEGTAFFGHGSGHFVLMDDHYRLVKIVHGGNGLDADEHESLITPDDTMLMIVYGSRPMDLSPIGGPKKGHLSDNLAQEIDIKTGKVLWQWSAADHVPITETHAPRKFTKSDFDFFHMNGLDVDDDGNILMSARNTWGVYKINRKSGKIMWRLGGKKSDFKMGPGTNYEWQHDIRRQPDGTLTLFDNGAAPPVEKQSRVLKLKVDEQKKTATLVRAWTHPGVLAGSQGKAQFLPNGDVFVGWGAVPRFTEFSSTGQILFDGTFDKNQDNYRAYRREWHGHPDDQPTVASKAGKLYVSWNGATEVVGWKVVAGAKANSLDHAGALVPRTGFETAIPAPSGAKFAAVQALDGNAHILGMSKAVAVSP
jgi:hypothetical protein